MQEYGLLLARVALGFVWILAGGAKLAQTGSRREAVAAFGVLPPSVAAPVDAVIPIAELVLGVLLVVGKWVVAAAAVSSALLSAFTVAILFNLARGRRVPCPCFGEFARRPISWVSVARNAGLLALALLIFLARPRYLTLEGWQAGNAPLPGDPPPLDFIPVLMLSIGVLTTYALLTVAWGRARVVAEADGGPALSLAERPRLRRWLLGEQVDPSVQEIR